MERACLCVLQRVHVKELVLKGIEGVALALSGPKHRSMDRAGCGREAWTVCAMGCSIERKSVEGRVGV